MTRAVLLYGDVNLRYRDGSRIWLESIVRVLRDTGSEATLALKAHPDDGIEDLRKRFGCAVLLPSETHRSRGAGMTPAEARDHLIALDKAASYDVILTRGYDIARALSMVERFDGRLWPYITDGPGFSPLTSGADAPHLTRIAP